MTEHSNRSAEIDLRWLYTDARCPGFRSPLGPQLEMLRAGILFAQRTYTERDAVPEQYLKDRERAIEIEAKLFRLDEHQRRVLWLAFAHGGRIGDGPTMALCSATKAARAGFLADSKARKLTPVVRKKPKSKAKAAATQALTIRGWLFRLALRAKSSDGKAQLEMLETILGEASRELDAALAAYVRLERQDGDNA